MIFKVAIAFYLFIQGSRGDRHFAEINLHDTDLRPSQLAKGHLTGCNPLGANFSEELRLSKKD
ncbi:MAG: hypothetical protein ACRC6M_02815 [Microcystaceae cyanobacterium]